MIYAVAHPKSTIVAAIKFNDGADTFARRKGLFVIPFTGEDTFTLLDPTIPPKAF